MKSASPKRIVLFMVDGLHVEALQHVAMPVLGKLIPQGAYAPESWMILPHHPTVGEYGRMHTTSFPNPVLMAGNLFVHAHSRFLQEVINPMGQTAFFANSNAYRSVARGFHKLVQLPEASDAQIVDQAISALRQDDFVFLRLHLQTAGNVGRCDCAYAPENKPYHRNIWGAHSPYTQTLAEADALLGKFIIFLKEQYKWEETIFIFTSDHGQSIKGWHPISDEDSWRTPLLFLGPGIAAGRQLAYAEHTDLAPTICSLMNLEAPNPGPGSGQPIRAVLADHPDDSPAHARFIQRLNRQNLEYLNCRALLQLASSTDSHNSSELTLLENELCTPEPFYSVDRFLEWHRAGSTPHLLEANENILNEIRPRAKACARLLGLNPELFP